VSRREEFEVGAGPEVELAVDAGRITVTTGPAGRITVEVDGDDDGWEIRRVGDSVSARPTRRWRSRSTRLDVVVPEGCRVVARTASADVAMRGRFGDTRIKTASGSVEVEALTAFQLSTASGDVHAGDVAGDVDLATVSGDVRLGSVVGRLAVTTTSGDVSVRSVGGDLGVSSVSGDVRVDRFDGDEVTVKSVSGDFDIGLPSGIRVSPSIRTLSGTTTLPEQRRRPDDGSPRRRVRLAFRSASGDLTIRRFDDVGGA
jgi:DUF4097 and DUF4098 domain-containing protein YvlB